MNGSAAINLKERQTHTYRQTDRQTDRQRFEDTRRTNALGDEDENGELRHRLTMERHWKYCLIFSLIQWTKVSAIQEVCVNVQDQIVLDCSSSGGGVPEEERTITISEACLCLGCSSLCFCLKIDWDYCEGRTYCSFQLSSEELSRFRIRLSPSEIEILSLVVDSIQIKAKYSCSPAIPDKTTVVQTSRRTPLTTSWPKTTEQSTTTGSPPGTTYSVPPSEGQVKVTRSTEPDEYPVHPEDRSHGSGYGETSYTEPPVHA